MRTGIAPLTLLVLLAACERVPTSITMDRSLDLIARLEPGLAGVTVLRFRTGTDLDAPWVTRRSAMGRARFPAAGSESPPCNDGTRHTLINERDFVFVSGIGDTGDQDISDDLDCGCDAHVSELRFPSLQVEFADGTFRQYERSLGKAEFCPNTVQDAHVGTRNFDSDVDATVNTLLEVRDGRLMLDVRYSLISAPPP